MVENNRDITDLFRQAFTESIQRKIELILDQHESFEKVQDEILNREMETYFLNLFVAVRLEYGSVDVSKAARFLAYDRTNFRKKIKQFGLNIEDLLERSENITFLEIPLEIIEKGYTFYRTEYVLKAARHIHYTSLLEKYEGNVSGAAREVGVDRSNFRRSLKALGIYSSEL
jgi:DNA-binding protein Fis